MASLQTLIGNASLISTMKGSERVGSIPGAESGGTNLSNAFAAVQPRTEAEVQMYEAAAALSTGSGKPITAESYLDLARSSREASEALAGFKPNFNLGDFGKKITEGTDALTKKFTSFDIGKKFDKVATSAKTFLFGQSPEAIAKMNPAAAALAKASLDAASKDDPSAASMKQAVDVKSPDDKSHLVTLTDNEGYVLEFTVMPEIVENRSVEYEAVAPPQFPGAFQKYKGTTSVQWSVNATFISRTTAEATRNLEDLNRLRGWTMPYFGVKTQDDSRFRDRIGGPPPVLKFKGFRESIVGEVPVVITSLNWNWPRDVDYIPARALVDLGEPYAGTKNDEPNIPFPTVIQVAIQLVESFSTEQFNNLNLAEYRVGHMAEAFGKLQNSGNVPTGQPEQREEAQVPPAGAFRGMRSDALPSDPNRIYPSQTTLSSMAGAGRGMVNPPMASEAILSVTPNIQTRPRRGGTTAELNAVIRSDLED